MPNATIYTFESRDHWLVVAALNAAKDMIAKRGDAPHWTDDPDLGTMTVTVAVATRLQKRGAA